MAQFQKYKRVESVFLYFMLSLSISLNGCSEAARNASSNEPTSDVVPNGNIAVGGVISGLIGDGLVLRNYSNGDEVTIATNGSFTLPTTLNKNSAYEIHVKNLPSKPDQSCTVTNGNGVVASASVADITVTCTPLLFLYGTDGAPSNALYRSDGTATGTTTSKRH